MAFLKQVLQQQLEESFILRSQEISAVLAVACNAQKASINIHATAIGVSELLDRELR